MELRHDRVIDELKKGTAEMLILSVLSRQPRHGYEIAKEIGRRSGQGVHFRAASLYPLLYRMEQRKWIEGEWRQEAGKRRRRYYRLTASGRRVLADQVKGWRSFVSAIEQVVGVQHA